MSSNNPEIIALLSCLLQQLIIFIRHITITINLDDGHTMVI